MIKLKEELLKVGLIVHCNTEEKANNFLKMLGNLGYYWNVTQNNLHLKNNYEEYKELTCYKICNGNRVVYGSYEYYKDYKETIIEYEDVIINEEDKNINNNQKQFTLSDLKDGMVVTLRNSRKEIVIENNIYRKEDFSLGNCLSNYNEDLTCKNCSSNFDIMKVSYMGELIWERKEKQYYTLEEAFNKAEGKRIKHKDSNIWCATKHHALYNTCEDLNKDMNEVLQLKEFEIEGENE